MLPTRLLDAFEAADDVARQRDLLSLLQDLAARDAASLRPHLARIQGLRGRTADGELRRGLAAVTHRVRGHRQGMAHAFGLAELPPQRRQTLESTLAGLARVTMAPAPDAAKQPWETIYEPLGLAPAAEGGFGEVFHMRRKSDGVEVAIKFLREDRADAPGIRARFAREAEVLKRIHDAGGHPHLLPWIDHGHDHGDLYLVTRWARGGSLHDLLRVSPTGLPPDQVLPWMRQVLEGLAAMHGQGLIHRDLKPGNLYLSGDGDADGGPLWIGDFGVVLPLGEERLTSMAVPTPYTQGYAPPEQRDETDQDGRTDLYAWAVTAFRLLSGVFPRSPDQGVREFVEVPPAWDRLLMACRQPDMDDRPASAEAALAAVARC